MTWSRGKGSSIRGTIHPWTFHHYCHHRRSLCTAWSPSGDVGPWWSVVVGMVLVWVALDMLGVAHCSMSGSLMSRFTLRGYGGAFVLGLAYGVLSGSCTFGFIAPILAIITVHGEIATGTILILLFGLGHCLPIAVAGSSASLVRRLLDNPRWQTSGMVFKKLAGVTIGLLGLYFILQPFF